MSIANPASKQPLSPYEANTLSNQNAVGLSTYVQKLFEAFYSARKPFEDIWIECWQNYLGEYQQSTTWKKETEGKAGRSKVFIKLTTLKCNTAHAKIMDAAFAGGNIPFETEPIKIDELGIPLEVAKDIAAKVKSKLQDHFKEIELQEIFDSAVLECAILGTAVLKGPIVETRRKQKVELRKIGGIPVNQFDADLNPYEIANYDETVAVVDHVPLWEYYTDPNAKSNRDAIGEIHYQRLLPAKFRELAYQGGYDAQAILDAATRFSVRDKYDTRFLQLGDTFFQGDQGEKDERISVVEYWGLVPVNLLKDNGVEIPEGTDEDTSLEALIVLAADGVVIKACLNPLGHRPFYVCPYKKRPHVIYGMGVAEAMRDSQKMINSSARLIIDNKALSGNGMIGLNLDRLNTKKTGDLKCYPGKVFYTKGNFAPREVIDSVKFQDVTLGLKDLMETFERFADEETGIPKYTQGEQASFLNKTAAGMSMLMTQANINLKTVMKNMDDYWIEPIVEAFYGWEMEMGQQNDAKIPLKIKAKGTDSLMAKEMKLESLSRFMQVTQAPQDAMFIDRPKLMREIARLLEVEDVMRSKEEIKQIMGEMSKQANTPTDMKEYVSLDKLYPLLMRNEQVQILQSLGIQPDSVSGPPSPDKPAQAAVRPSGATSTPSQPGQAPSISGGAQ